MEREFGVKRDDPAYVKILSTLSQLTLLHGIKVREHPDLVTRAIAKARDDFAFEESLADYRPARKQAAQFFLAPELRQPWVYYLRVGAMVKIGTTVNLDDRLKAYPPDAILLATEPGTYDVERQRHRQFAASKAARNEWFHPSAALIEHINTLRPQPLTAADLAA